MEINNPRQLARRSNQSLNSAALWSENERFVANLRQRLMQHPIATPVIQALRQSALIA